MGVINQSQFRNVLGHYPTGVCVVAARDLDGSPVAMVVGSFTSVSLDPPLVGFLPARSSTTWPTIREASRFCVNVLAADQAALCQQVSKRGPGRLDGINWTEAPTGGFVLDGALAAIDCDLHRVFEAGDHDFVLGSVLGVQILREEAPLIFHRGSLGTL
ncbi:flavin reductase family protein [Tianweitania sediminis]|uniref:Flavin reductase family protein n=1 Tax=Tianweitania sediminis TaxID=1502156 RepID=A0A8J7RKF7_9HYPH|nr:flavin reductase family protein [Tianweitania sediminis]MBP0437349.1 flavin reductase family protein [Tianweitania sediminis]